MPTTLEPDDATPASFSPAALEALHLESRRRTDELRRDFAHELDVLYGPHPRQRVDVYLPDGPPAGPVLVFLHGGGFRAGDHHSIGYHGRPYLDRGAIFVTMGYRLVPDLPFPEMCDDVEAGLNWLAGHVADKGGDPGQIHLSGHSAGAALAAMVALRPLDLRRPDLVRGLVAISGPYDYRERTAPDTDTASRRFVPDLTAAVERLPEHTIVIWGDHDLPFAAPDGEALASAIEAKGGSVDRYVEPDADHFQANRSFVDPAGTVAGAVNAMMGLQPPHA